MDCEKLTNLFVLCSPRLRDFKDSKQFLNLEPVISAGRGTLIWFWRRSQR